MRAINRDTVVAIILLLFCGVFYAASYQIKETTYATIGAEVWPRIILGLMFVLCTIYLFQSVRQPAAEKAEEGAARPGFLARYRNAILCYALFFVFLLTLDILGMLLGGMAFVFAALTVLGERTPRQMAIHAAVAVVSIGAMWAIFTFALRVFLPEGIIFRIW